MRDKATTFDYRKLEVEGCHFFRHSSSLGPKGWYKVVKGATAFIGYNALEALK